MRIDAVLEVLSPDDVVSPFTGRRAAAFFVEILEDDVPLGTMWIGDVLSLDGMKLVVRRATMAFVNVRPAMTPFGDRIPAEAAPFLKRARGGGVLGFREHAVVKGARLRVQCGDDSGPVSLAETFS